MESGEVDASIFSDYFVLANYPEDMRMICSITYSPEFQDEPCCVTAMNNKFIEENPVHAKYVVMAIKRAGEYSRLNSEDAVQAMFDTDKMTGEKEDQMVFWDSLHFGLSDAFTERALKEIAEDYIRLGIIEDKDICNPKKNNNYIIKLHGDIDKLSTIVLKEQDYLGFSETHKLIEPFFKLILAGYTILFIGYSLNDYKAYEF